MNPSLKKWPLSTVGLVCKTTKGKKPANSGALSTERKVPYINIRAFESRQPDQFAQSGDYPRCDEQDVLMVWDGARSGLVGRGVSGYIGSTLARVQSDALGSDFLFYFLQSKYTEINSRTKGVGIPHVNPQVFEAITIPLPPPAAQRRIVAELEKQFTRLEAGVTALRRVQANLKRYRAAVLKAACEGRLVPTEAGLQKSACRGQKSKAKFETGAELLARILTERRQNWQGRGQYKEPAAPDTAKLSPLPEGYTWASFGQICRVQGGFAFKSTDYVKEGVPLVRISNLVNGRVQVSQDTVFLPHDFATANPAFVLRKGDVLIAMSGATTGKMATMEEDIPALLNQRVGRFVLSSAKLSNAKFVSYLVMQITQKVLKDAYGAAQPNISPSEIEEMPIPLPPLAEQTRIVAEVERRLSVVEELESVVSANLQRATRLRQSILQKAFTGELIQ
jgi:type I restriction enzyme, S subunit